MSYQVLARKYRPQKFSDVIGQDHVTRTLKNALEQGRIGHGYIFSGHRGIGKTTIARILAMALNCQSSDRPVTEPCGVCDSCREIREGSVGSMNVIEIDAATNRGIDEVRNIIATAEGQPTSGIRYRIFILDEAHQVTDAAFNALLKTLEEPPPWVVFMMATTQPEDIPQTIRSRCQHFSFHAVRFDNIVGQLRAISDKEGIKVDDDALAMLAEAGDGSMRDALSIMDQAIACCGTTLTAELVRGLVGTVNSEVLERVMDGVHRNSSEDVLRIVDKLVVEGHSPAHFARQLVRFLRNATVAKVAGKDSSLLQISSDDRERVSRVAEWFREEDLARFLQIMLRTHGDVSYKAEQRFHLELGMLKMVHAQRLLPLEEFLSGAAAGSPALPSSRPAAARPLASPSRTAAPAPSFAESRAARPSPFEADRNRKSREEMSSAPAVGDPMPPRAQSAQGIASIAASADSVAVAVQEAPEPQPEPTGELNIDAIREAVLLEFQDQKTLYGPLEEGEWLIQGAEIVVRTSLSPTLLEFAFGADLKRRAVATVVRVAGRPMKFTLVGGANGATNGNKPARPAVGGTSARAKAAQHPVVRKMIDKFGAEIRTVMDPDRK
ncbi:MAG TPA: DNA polymerase III subunit gamma/tau [Terriglobales bacterium]|nr:DNA polymerase III subunit gamma/tau [Terriglobales bacterium]